MENSVIGLESMVLLVELFVGKVRKLVDAQVELGVLGSILVLVVIFYEIIVLIELLEFI